MMRFNQMISFSFMGFSLLIFFSSLQVGIGDLRSPGPGFLPLLASVLLFSVSLFVFVGIKKPDEKEKEGSLIDLSHSLKPACLVLGLIGYAFLVSILGYLITTFVFMFVMLTIAEPKKWRKNIISAVVIIIISFLIFNKWLRVPLPAGIFRGW